jgi:hypothetical protein
MCEVREALGKTAAKALLMSARSNLARVEDSLLFDHV